MKKTTSDIVIGSIFLTIYFLYLIFPTDNFNPVPLFLAALGSVELITGIFSLKGYYQKKMYIVSLTAVLLLILTLNFIQMYLSHYTNTLFIFPIMALIIVLIAYDLAHNMDKSLKLMQEYRNILETNPDDFKIWNNYGIALKKIKEYKRAIEAYDKALEINPGYTTAMYNKAIILAERSKYKKAIETYNKVLEIDPEDVNAWINKGNSLATIGKFKEALECYDKVLEIDPENAKAKFNKGIIQE
jgi:tetratricopeptide (TPR) repeat protein